jgi:hypothetical protein
MASQDIKDFLFEQTGVPAAQWKRLSKKKTPEGEVRMFENKAGTQVETLESSDGLLSIMGNDTATKQISPEVSELKNNLKKAKKLVSKYFEEDTVPEANNPGYSSIPALFKFSFMEDANPDHSEHLEMAAQAGDKSVAVTGFNIFITSKAFQEYSCVHLSELLSSFLPTFLDETEESSFCIHSETQGIYDDERLDGIKNGSIPNIPYDRLIATMEAAGFEYDPSTCMLASLGGSQGAKPL